MVEVVFTDQNFSDEVLKDKGVVLVDFFAPWCGPCKMMEPAIKAVANEYAGKVKIGKMNIDENNQIPSMYGIQSIPTTIIFKNGEPMDSKVGFQSAEDLKRRLNSSLN